ncbi:MAG: glycosyltransferase [Thermomicrobiales bacterium]
MHDVVIDLRDGGDWSLDLCFAGLVSNLGANRVLDMPYKEKHREWNPHSTETSWGLERRTLGYTPDNISIPAMEEFSHLMAAEGQIKRVWLDERMESFQKYRQLGFYDAKVPVVVVAGHDRFWNQSPSFVANLYGERLMAMGLDNWYPEYAKLPFRTFNIRWSCNFDHYWKRPDVPPEKDIDICFIGFNSHPARSIVIEHVEKRWGHLKNHLMLERNPDSFDNFVSRAEMFAIMQRSKVCLNIRGAADRGKTLRAYEIPYVGSFMLSQTIPDPGLMDDFVGGEHCEYFTELADLDVKIERALDDKDTRERIALAGHRRAIEDLSTKQRWGSVLRWLEDPFQTGHEDNWRILL